MRRVRTITQGAAVILLAGTVAAGCGGGRIGEIASERAATATLADAPRPAVTTAPTPTTAPPQADAGTATGSDIASARTRFEQDVRSTSTTVGAMVAAIAVPTLPSGAPALVQQVSGLLREYDAAVASLGSYSLSDRPAEDLRRKIVDNAPATSEAIRAFTESAQAAANSNDQAALDEASRTLAAALSRFPGAAAPSGTTGQG